MNGSYSYGQGGGYHYNPNPKRPRRDGDWGDWLGIVVLLFLPLGITQVIAVVWLVSKLRNMTRQQAQNYAFQARQAAEFVKGKAGEALGSQSPMKRKGFAPGTVKMVVGGVMAGMFALGTVAQLATFVESLLYGFFFSLHLLGVFLFGKSFALLSCLSRGKIVCHCDYLSFTFLFLGFGCWCTVCAGAFFTSGFDTSGSLRSASFCCLDCALYRSSFAFTDGFLCLSLTVPLSVCISTGSESCLDGGFLSVLATVGFDWEYPSF